MTPTRSSRIIGIDPGITGAFALFDPATPNLIAAYDLPIVGGEIDPHALTAELGVLKADLIAVEQVGPMPKDGVRQAWRFSAAYATIRCVVTLMRKRMLLIPAQTWKKELRLRGGKAGKEASRARALALFPSNAQMFSRKMDANRAEAALIAYYVGVVRSEQPEINNPPKAVA